VPTENLADLADAKDRARERSIIAACSALSASETKYALAARALTNSAKAPGPVTPTAL